MGKAGLVAIAVALFGCKTPYQSQSFSGGYTSAQLGANRHAITVKVNAYTSEATAMSYVYRRAGELCPWGFDVVSGVSGSNSAYMVNGGMVQEIRKPEVTAVVECKPMQPVAARAQPGSDSAQWYCTSDGADEDRSGCFRTEVACGGFRGRKAGYTTCVGSDRAVCVGAFSIDSRAWLDVCGASEQSCANYRNAMIDSGRYERTTECQERR